MRKILNANFTRLLRDKIFFISIIAALILGVLDVLNACRLAAINVSILYTIDKYYFHFAIFIGFVSAIFSSMFVGTDYSEGTLRNKIIVGTKRTSIYLSNLITTFVTSFLVMLVWLIGTSVGLPSLGGIQMSIKTMAALILISTLMIAAFSAIFTLLSMNISNKAVSVIVSVLLFLGLLIFVSSIYNALQEPEYTSGLILTQNGIEEGEPNLNPRYVDGETRKIFEFIVDFLPTGQGLTLSFVSPGNPIVMALSSVFITIITTLIGLFSFGKKDLK